MLMVIAYPSMKMEPGRCGSTRRKSAAMRLLLPLPVRPHTPTFSRARICTLIPFSTKLRMHVHDSHRSRRRELQQTRGRRDNATRDCASRSHHLRQPTHAVSEAAVAGTGETRRPRRRRRCVARVRGLARQREICAESLDTLRVTHGITSRMCEHSDIPSCRSPRRRTRARCTAARS